MPAAFEMQCIAVLTAAACALPGAFLVLRKMAMLADSVTHTVLLGIVLAFLVTRQIDSPWLALGAVGTGAATVFFTEWISKTNLVAPDAAIGIVFPLLFAVAIILIARYAGSVHLDTDAVLLGELAFAPFDRLIVRGVDMGAKALYTAAALLLLNVSLTALFYKELTLAAFDPILAALLGFSPVVLHYGLMTAVSVTAVGAFEAVGAVLVVAFMVGPPAAACLLTRRLPVMLVLSTGIAAFCAVVGCQAALALDTPIAGTTAVVIGLVFTVVFVAHEKQETQNREKPLWPRS